MRPTLRVLHVHKPLIRFLGKRSWPATPEPPQPHPAGPPEYKAHFADFLKKYQSSSSPSSSSSSSSAPKSSSKHSGSDGHDAEVYQEFWQAPPRVWNPRVRKLSEEEMEAVLSGGASLH